MAKNSSKPKDKNASKPTRTPTTPAADAPVFDTAVVPHAPWFLFSIRCVAVGLLSWFPFLLREALRLGPTLGWYQALFFLIYSVVTLAVVCIGLGVPFRFFGRAGKQAVDVRMGGPP